MNKLFALIFITFVVYSQQADVAGIVKGVCLACCSGNNVPAAVCKPMADALANAVSGLGRRRLGLTGQLVTAGCNAGYTAAAGAAGVPAPVSKCFQANVVSQCTSQVSSALGVRRLRGGHSSHGHRTRHIRRLRGGHSSHGHRNRH